MIKSLIGKIHDMMGRHPHLIRYAVVGVVNTGVDFLFYSICVGLLNLHVAIGQVVGVTAGIINSFIFNRSWTFKDTAESQNTSVQFTQFVVVNLISLGISALGLTWLVDQMHINKYVAKILVTGAVLVINYLSYKLWVFKKEAPAKPE